jgi:transposase
VGASERELEFLRAAWRALVAGKIDAERLVFVDEMGSNTSLAPLHAWAPRGERARCSVPRNRGKNTTLLASMTSEGMGPCVAVVGITTAAVFEAYVERALAQVLRPGQVVVLDNLGAHKGERVRKLIEGRGCELLFLPPYSPDLNPIEEAFSKVKALLRRAGARTREALVEAMGRALDAVSTKDARGFFGHCGYPLPAQPL